MAESIFTEDFSTDPYWWDAAPRPAPSPAELPRAVDVAIVGSGYTGLSAALTLARGGREVLVIEAERLGEGGSTRNAGFVAKVSLLEFSRLCRRFGAAKATELYNEGKRARAYLGALVESEQIACHYRAAGRFTAAHTPRAYRALTRELEFKRKYVKINADMVPAAEQRRELGSDRYCGGMVTHDAGEIHPALYQSGLAARVLAAGARIADGTRVTGLAPTAQGTAVATTRGTVEARDVVLATNGYTPPEMGYFHRRIVPVLACQIVTEPIATGRMDGLIPNRRTVFDTKAMFNWMRPTPDGSRLLFGGNFSRRPDDLREVARQLHQGLVGVFPELDGIRISHCWDGRVGFTFDYMPHIGVRDGVHYAVGMNGAGVITGTWLGHKLGLRILGEGDSATVFDGSRFPTLPFYRGNPWFLPLFTGVYGLRDKLRL